MDAPIDLDIRTKDRKDVFLGLYCESCTHARHYEGYRATISNIMVLATVGLVGYIHHLDHGDWPLTLAIMLAGILGSIFSAFYFKRIKSYEKRADECRKALKVLLFGPPGLTETELSEILLSVDNSSAREFLDECTRSDRLRMFWPLVIAFLGLAFTIVALFR